MPTIPTLPAQGNTSWYPWATAMDSAARVAFYKPAATTAFASRSDGAFTLQDTGQTVTNTGSSQLTIASGVLTHTNTGSGSAGYAETNLGVRLGRIGATFQIPDITKSGTLTFVAPSTSWVSGGVGSSAAGCHFYLTATTWAYQVHDGTSLTTLVSGTISLASATDYELEITYEGSTARVALPDGRVITVTDSRINSTIGTIGLIECYESSATTVPVKISAVRIDGVQQAPLTAPSTFRLLAGAAAPQTSAATHTDYDTTVSGTVEIGGGNARVALTVPPTGKILARISSMLELQATDNVYAYPQFTYDAGGNVTGASVSALRATGFQRITLDSLVTGLTPGASGVLAWFTAKTGSATAIWHSGNLNGSGVTSAIPIK